MNNSDPSGNEDGVDVGADIESVSPEQLKAKAGEISSALLRRGSRLPLVLTDNDNIDLMILKNAGVEDGEAPFRERLVSKIALYSPEHDKTIELTLGASNALYDGERPDSGEESDEGSYVGSADLGYSMDSIAREARERGSHDWRGMLHVVVVDGKHPPVGGNPAGYPFFASNAGDEGPAIRAEYTACFSVGEDGAADSVWARLYDATGSVEPLGDGEPYGLGTIETLRLWLGMEDGEISDTVIELMSDDADVRDALAETALEGPRL